MTDGKTQVHGAVRPLRISDLERMIAIDQAYTGRARRRFLEKRLQAAERRAQDFIHVGVESDTRLVGFVLARVLHGEFGREQPVAALDVIGVDPAARDRGYGHQLMQGLTAAMRKQDVRRLHSQAEWTNGPLLKFFAAAGFELSPRMVLERAVSEPLAEAIDEL
jgi:ribosomal protein S18 acetylase RimI-like enzyme